MSWRIEHSGMHVINSSVSSDRTEPSLSSIVYFCIFFALLLDPLAVVVKSTWETRMLGISPLTGMTEGYSKPALYCFPSILEL